ncbi:MAG TPA: TIM-barrel domain-containing protein [Armatimonadota bacterium]|nr:TIM-barrel domain-containing protein [Armatimonadota bacterium]
MSLSNHPTRYCLAMLLCNMMAIVIACAQSGQITSGNARFTVVTPNCIRLEYAPGGKFIDAASYFAVNRDRHDATAKIENTNGVVRIQTSAMTLTYTPNGKGFSADNLKADIRKGKGTVTWKPGMPNPGNLGGTSRTLDGWDGARNLGDGVISRDGWYLLDDSRSVLFTKDWVESRPKDAGTDWYLFGYGTDFKAALGALTAIGGDIPLPRKYTMGAWYSHYWPYTSAEFRQIVKEYGEHDFPLDVMVMDMDWHKDGWTGWSWNRKLLPDAEDLLKWFHEQGLAVTLNVHPADGIKPHEDMYDAFMRDMGQDPTTKAVLPFDAGDKKYLDTMFKHTHDPLMKDGVDFWWLDWQQYANTRSIPDLTNLAWLNHYYYQYTGSDGKRGQSFSRWAGWGDHRHPIHFSGDASTKWRMLTFEVPFTSTAGNVGCFFWSHDIGGHMGGRNEESYTRWCQFGATSAALRSHSTRSAEMDRRPWNYPKWAEDSMRISFHLRSEIFPYIYSSAWESCKNSIPLNRPMYIDYPHEERSYHNAQEYLFGDNLLVAPITMPGVGPNRVGRQIVWFPQGDWYNFFTGERYTGTKETQVSADINEFPLYVRGGIPLPMQPYTPHMGTAPLKTLRIRCYPGIEGKHGSFTLYEDDGVTMGYQNGEFATTELSYIHHNGKVTVTVHPVKGSFPGQVKQRGYIIELPCTEKTTRVTVDGKAAQAEYDEKTCTNRIMVAECAISQGCVVTAVVKSADNQVLGLRAFARRAGVTNEQLAGVKTIKQAFSIAMKSAAADLARRDGILSAAGIGFIQKNETPYLFPADEGTLYFSAPAQFLDEPKVTWVQEMRVGNTVTTLGKAESPLHERASVPEQLMQVKPSHSFRKVTLKAAFRAEGQECILTLPTTAMTLTSADDAALSAKVSVSSTENGYWKQGINDGVIDGYPNEGRREWSSNGGKNGTWVQLDWDKEQTIDHIWLFDRINTVDQITSGELTFSDGSSIKVGELPNDGSEPADIGFAPKKVTWVKFTVDSVKAGTQNAGLAEFVVWRATEAK